MGSWRLRGRMLETGGRKQLNMDGSLTIRDVQSTDEGNYTCKVENNLGTDEILYFVKVRGEACKNLLSAKINLNFNCSST